MAAGSLTFTVHANGSAHQLVFEVGSCAADGWGANRDALEAHIEELARIGVPRPSQVPIYLNFATHLLTTGGDMTAFLDSGTARAHPETCPMDLFGTTKAWCCFRRCLETAGT